MLVVDDQYAARHGFVRPQLGPCAQVTLKGSHQIFASVAAGGLDLNEEALLRILSAAGVPDDKRERTANVLHGSVSGLLLAETLGHISGDQMDETYETAIDIIVRGLPER